MAEIKNLHLDIKDINGSNKKTVTVTFGLSFAAQEVGKTFRYGITLRGEDKAGDDEAAPLKAAAVLYAFSFASPPQLPKSYKAVAGQANELPVTEIREVPTGTLNEDPGFHTLNAPGVPPGKIPHADEVYANVDLIADQERSNTVSLLV